ncbi:hypothetical protein V2S66_26755 [Streptomyces sp. V4-01]|uniref:Uncharacterized protein n=1 Tax=Actinacidiphila polyblastidii TaxID=3110430 RepID=A0ABU7PJX1_9ACTN|nr:hypothetical protein [Streptomyces sp. V4-01]
MSAFRVLRPALRFRTGTAVATAALAVLAVGATTAQALHGEQSARPATAIDWPVAPTAGTVTGAPAGTRTDGIDWP